MSNSPLFRRRMRLRNAFAALMRQQFVAAASLLLLAALGAGVAAAGAPGNNAKTDCRGNSCHENTTTTTATIAATPTTAAISTSTTTTTTAPTSTTTAPTTTTTTSPTTTTTTTTPTTATTVVSCNLYASPNGSDSNSGSVTSPFATLVKLDQSLAAGQNGCLRGGTYGSTSTEMDLTKNGTASGQITITAFPGETPLVKGWINLTGAYTTLSYLKIDGSNSFYTASRSGCAAPVSQGLVIAGASDIFEHNELFQSVASLRGNGIGIGWWGKPDNSIVRFNKIHDVGGCQAYDHLIYLAHGDNVQIYGNWMWTDSHGWGVQLYPAPTNAKVFSNVIDGAGTGFVIGDNGSATTTGNQVYHNIVVNEVGVPSPANIAGACIGGYPPVAGSNNSFKDNNCASNPGGIGSQANVQMSGNSTTSPLFIGATAHDYRVSASSSAASWGMWDGN